MTLTKFCGVLLVGSCAVFAALGETEADTEPPKRIESPNRRVVLEMLGEPMPGADIMDFFTLRVSLDRKKLMDLPTYGYFLEAFWSASGRYVAINNRRGNSGDYLWVIDLEKGQVVKHPDNEDIMRRGAALVKEFWRSRGPVEWGKEWLVAKGWGVGDQLLLRYLATTRGRGPAAECFFQTTPRQGVLVVLAEKVGEVP
jgi:hypothetical protein